MARARTAKHPKAKTAAEAPPQESSDARPSVSKAEAVRRAMAAGMDSPGDIADFAKSNFGLDIPKQQVSAYKAIAKKKAGKTAAKAHMGRKPKAAPSGPVAGHSNGIIEDLTAVKELVNKLGGDQVKKLVDLFG